MASHSSVLAWRIPGTGEPGGLPSMGSHRVRHDWSDLAAAAAAVRFSLIFGVCNLNIIYLRCVCLCISVHVLTHFVLVCIMNYVFIGTSEDLWTIIWFIIIIFSYVNKLMPFFLNSLFVPHSIYFDMIFLISSHVIKIPLY